MSIIEEVFQGSFKGVPIRIETAETEGGRKISKKSYPNRDTQTLEDLGLNPRKYVVSIVVASSSTELYFPQKASLLALLEQPDPGELIHPFYGSLPNMVAVSWRIIEEVVSLGYGKLSVTFEVSEGTGIPVTAGVSETEIAQSLEDLNETQNQSFTDKFLVTVSSFGNPQSAIAKIGEGVDAIRDAVAFTGEIATGLEDFNNSVGELVRDITNLITEPQRLADSLNNVFFSMNNLFDSPERTLDSFANLFNFGFTDTSFPDNGPVAVERRQNNEAVNELFNVAAISGAYNAVLNIEPTTKGQVDAIAEALEAQYLSIYNNDLTDPDTKLDLTKSRALVVDFLDQLRLRAAELVDVTVDLTPARVLGFEYYNDSTRGLEISRLNEQYDVSFIEGNIQLFSET